MVRDRDPVEYGKALAAELGRKLDAAAEKALASCSNRISEITAFVEALPLLGAKKAAPAKKKVSKDGEKEE